jgi:Cu(I)/Ag(I) efflux system membrane fusion protein
VYEPREVRTGWSFADRVEIVDGLKEGERIVVSGNFLIDSESRMKLAAAGLANVAAAPVNVPPDNVSPSVHGSHDGSKAGPSKVDEAKAVDPVCAMKVDREQAETAGLTVDHNGEVYYFCSEDCREQFARSPRNYTEKSGGSIPLEGASGQHMGHAHD